MANTWNQSGTTWGQNSYGLQTEVNVSLTGLSLTSTIGSLDSAGSEQGWGSDAYGIENWGQSGNTVLLTGLQATVSVGILSAYGEQGWGRDAYGLEPWGESFDPVIALPGFSLTSTLGEFPYAQSTDGWGSETWGEENWGQNATTAILTGLSLTSTLGEFPYAQATDGWGRDSWNQNAWGIDGINVSLTGFEIAATLPSMGWGDQVFGSDNEGWGGIYQLPVADVMGLTGLSIDADLGTATAKSDFSTTLTALSTLVVSPGLLSTDDHSVGLTGFEIDANLGTATTTQLTIAALTGLNIDADVGAITISSNPIQLLTGLSAQTALGSLTVDDTTMGLTGLSAQTALGALTTTQLSIASLDGLGLTATTTLNDAGIRLRYYETLTPKDSSGYTIKTPKNTTGYTIKEAL
jgi:hypothetical protein